MRTDFARGSSHALAPVQLPTESQPWAPRHVDCMHGYKKDYINVEGHVQDYMQYLVCNVLPITSRPTFQQSKKPSFRTHPALYGYRWRHCAFAAGNFGDKFT